MKTVLITGAGSGIGLASVRQLLKEGYRVIAHYHSSSPELLQQKEEHPERLFLIRKDFLAPGSAAELWREVEKIGHGIDILINNAAVIPDPAPLVSLTEKALDDVLRVNLKVPFLLAQRVLPGMMERRWGRIINISSIGIKFGGGSQTAHYAISKAALEALTRTLQRAGSPYHITVNSLRAGVTNTKMHTSVPKKNLEERINLIPLKRMAEPDEIAHAILFLIAEKSGYIAGSTLTAAGGE
ncbi:MAG: SDR family oxidoreductase [Deltaproteobacteria bacterium]|nr:SDR family oxidoreductase [Deltaproteobacteria bacterium]